MEKEVPDLYADSVQIGMNPFGVILDIGVNPGNRQAGPVLPNRLCTIRMSLEHAKVLAILLRKNLRQFEGSLGTEIPLHPQMLSQLGISKKEDW